MTNPIRQFTNSEAELRVIGSALIDPEAIGKLSTLKADDFANMAHRNIWDALVDLGPVADWATVKTWLDRRAILADVEALIGPVEVYLLSAAQLIPTALNIDGYAADVVDMARRRELNAALSAAATANFKGEPLPAISSKIVQTMARIEPAEKRQTLADAIAEYSAEREGERDGTRTGGIPSGIGDLDRLTNGWKPGNLIVVAGPTGGGKTTLKLGFALNAAKRGHKVLYIGLEMSNAEIIRKAVADISGVDTGHSAVRAMTPEKWDEEHKAMNRLAGLPFVPVEAPGITIGGVTELVHKENAKGQIGLVVVDYLQAMGIESGTSRGESRATQIGTVTRTLKALAGQAGCAILLGSQLNRESGQSGEPQLYHLKESSSIEQDANMVMMIYDPEDKLRPNTRTLFLRKNRSGPVGAVPLVVRLDLSRMTGAERETVKQ